MGRESYSVAMPAQTKRRSNSSRPIAHPRSAKKKKLQTQAARDARNSSRNQKLPFALLVPETVLTPEMTPAAKVMVLEQICDHGSPTRACLAAGVGRRTFYGWLHEEDKVFAKEYARARGIWRASTIGDIEASFGSRAQFRDTLAGIFVLKHNTKRYREVSRVQLSGPDGGPIVTIDAKEELVKRLEQLLTRAASKPAIAAGSEIVLEEPGSRGLEVLKSQPEKIGVKRIRGGVSLG